MWKTISSYGSDNSLHSIYRGKKLWWFFNDDNSKVTKPHYNPVLVDCVSHKPLMQMLPVVVFVP